MSDMDTLVRNLRILLRTDLIIAEIHARRLLAKSGFFAVAALVGGFGAVMLGIAGFLALEERFGPILAAAITGGVAMLLAAVLVLAGARVRTGRELALATEVHAAALAAVNVDLKAAGANVTRFAAFMRNPIDTALPGMALTVLNLLLRAFRRGRSGSEG